MHRGGRIYRVAKDQEQQVEPKELLKKPERLRTAEIVLGGDGDESIDFGFDLKGLTPIQGAIPRSSSNAPAQHSMDGLRRERVFRERSPLRVILVTPDNSNQSLMRASVKDQLLAALGSGFGVEVQFSFRCERPLLTPAEVDVLRLKYRGCTAKEIAKFRACSHRTVEKHVENVNQKIGVSKIAPEMLRIMEACFNLEPFRIPQIPPK